MPHFVIHCAENILKIKTEMEIMLCVHDTADDTGLFKKGDIKVRIQAFENFIVGNGKPDFIHVFGNIMEGRTGEQKADLSRRIVTKLAALLPEVPVVSMNVSEFEKASYCNRGMI
jgi:5-carboxymethyl-2-hydroxymuconate isomerase